MSAHDLIASAAVDGNLLTRLAALERRLADVERRTTVDTTFDDIVGGGGVDFSGTSMASVGNIGSGEDNLITFTLPTGALVAGFVVGIRMTAWGTWAAPSANKHLRMYFGSTIVADSTDSNFRNGTWRAQAEIVRTSATAQLAIGFIYSKDTNVGSGTNFYQTSSTPAEDLTGAVTVKCTGEATNTDDIVQTGLIVEYLTQW